MLKTFKKATDLLSLHGLNGKALCERAPRHLQSLSKTKVTVPQSRERQDLLINAATAGSRFQETGGEFLNSGDYFIVQERKKRNIAYKIWKIGRTITLKSQKEKHNTSACSRSTRRRSKLTYK